MRFLGFKSLPLVLQAEMDKRATCWSLTINNPTDKDLEVELPAGWRYEGQVERGEKEGTPHAQLMLCTPQVRMAAVKKVFPRAHIEAARNARALAKYVHKDDTRVAEIDARASNIPTLFDYQHTIAGRWDSEYFKTLQIKYDKLEFGEVALIYVDELVAQDIEAGVLGVEYIGINPMWRSAWKKFYRSMVAREKILVDRKTDRQTDNEEDDTPGSIEAAQPAELLSSDEV